MKRDKIFFPRAFNFFCCVFFLLLFTSCKNFKEVQCTGVKGFAVNKIDLKGIDASLMLGIKNPNTTGFSVYRSKFDVYYNDIYLGKAISAKRVYIAANTEKTYSFNIKSDFKNVSLTDVMKLVSGGGRGEVKVTGNLKAGKFLIRKKFPVDVKERVSLNR